MKTVLLVDDQLELQAIHRTYLEQNGYRVILASDGETALDLARSEIPDLIMLDHSLPRRTGIEVARELKHDRATAHIPVLLVTAHSYGAIGRKAKDAGVDAFLSKPCGPRRMLSEVARFVGV